MLVLGQIKDILSTPPATALFFAGLVVALLGLFGAKVNVREVSFDLSDLRERCVVTTVGICVMVVAMVLAVPPDADRDPVARRSPTSALPVAQATLTTIRPDPTWTPPPTIPAPTVTLTSPSTPSIQSTTPPASDTAAQVPMAATATVMPPFRSDINETDDFSAYNAGSFPAGWIQLGDPRGQPSIREVQGVGYGAHVFYFPRQRLSHSEKVAISTRLFCRDFTTQVKVNVSGDDGDATGIVVGWLPDAPSDYSAVYLNHTHKAISIRDYASQRNVTTPDGIALTTPDTDFWLQVNVTSSEGGSGRLAVSWSLDGHNFIDIEFPDYGRQVPVTNVIGLAGVTTFGVHLPEAYFDDFRIIGSCRHEKA